MQSNFSPKTHSASVPETTAIVQKENTEHPQQSEEVHKVASQHELKKLDLTAIRDDKESLLNKRTKLRINEDGFNVLFTVMDLDQVYISSSAEMALDQSYLKPTYLLDKYGSHYKTNAVATATRGKLKGSRYFDSKANTFTYETDGGKRIVVTGKCVEAEGKKLRQIHITCAESTTTSATT